MRRGHGIEIAMAVMALTACIDPSTYPKPEPSATAPVTLTPEPSPSLTSAPTTPPDTPTQVATASLSPDPSPGTATPTLPPSPTNVPNLNDLDGDGYTEAQGDCDDNNASVHPNAEEQCNSIDDNCSGAIDEGVVSAFYGDADSDGYGNLAVSTQACSAPTGYVAAGTDCDDGNASIYPAAIERCDGKDQDCDSLIDEGVELTWYRDQDNDGYGDKNVSNQACTQPPDYVANSSDCLDNNASVFPGAYDVIGDGIDANCDGKLDYLSRFVGIGLYNGDGKAAAESTMQPKAAVRDARGNLYFSDIGGYRVRKIDSAGNVSTVAGIGTLGFSGDGGPAIQARLDPHGLAIDTAENLFVADRSAYRVRRISANGIIATVAGNGDPAFSGDGGPAISAGLGRPVAVTVDKAGNLFIADLDGCRIRKVNSAGVISTVAGTGTCVSGSDGMPANQTGLQYPNAVWIDYQQRLLIGDYCSVRRIETNGTLLTIVGSPSGCDFSGDGGTATAARLGSYVQGLADDSSGNLYVATADARVRRVSSSGTISTFAGTGEAGYSGDGGYRTQARISVSIAPVPDDMGNVYIVDAGNNRIRKVDTAGVIRTYAGRDYKGFEGDGGPASAALLNTPRDVAVDAQDNLFIADQVNCRIRRVDQAGIIATVAGSGSSDQSEDGVPATLAAIGSPIAIAVNLAGDLYFADGASYGINRVLNGIYEHFVVHEQQAPLTIHYPVDLNFDENGDLMAADANGNQILGVTVEGGLNVIAGDGSSGCSGDNGPAVSASLAQPSSVVEFDGAVYLADSGNHRIRSVDTSGNIKTVAGFGDCNSGGNYSGDNGAATLAELRNPRSLAFDRTGNLFVVDYGNQRVRRIDTSGRITTVAGTGDYGINLIEGPATSVNIYPNAIAFDSRGILYVVQTLDSVIWKLSP